jgi:NitT/TauT family transport system permease protein
MTATMSGAEADLIERRASGFAVRKWGWRRVQLYRLAVVAVALLLWQVLPSIPGLADRFRFLDSFFISSPVDVAKTLWGLLTGTGGQPLVWPYIGETLRATFAGVLIGIVAGAALGLVGSQDLRASQVITPFVYALNALPRIALIPIAIVLLGPSSRAAIAIAAFSTCFMIFFNAFAGGRAVPAEMIQGARLMGAQRLAIMMRIRLMYVAHWVFEAMPYAISHGLLVVVTLEVVGGSDGVGRLIVVGIANLNSALIFAVAVILAAIGIVLASAVEAGRGRLLHWTAGEK